MHKSAVALKPAASRSGRRRRVQADGVALKPAASRSSRRRRAQAGGVALKQAASRSSRRHRAQAGGVALKPAASRSSRRCITSNRAIEEWPPLFGDALLASAAMDRLLHHAHVITIEGHSFRNPPNGAGRRKGG